MKTQNKKQQTPRNKLTGTAQQTIKEVPVDKIIAVTKNQPKTQILKALDLGIKKFGENRIQEAEKKYKKHPQRKKIELHFIGKLQSNKIKKAVDLFDVIQTIENKKQIEKINKEAKNNKQKQKIYIQINITKDHKKNGAKQKEIKDLLDLVVQKPHIELSGLMTILKKGLTKKENYIYFKKLKKIQEKIQKTINTCTETSMGMSADYKEALRAGATEIRIGTALFGKRK